MSEKTEVRFILILVLLLFQILQARTHTHTHTMCPVNSGLSPGHKQQSLFGELINEMTPVFAEINLA